MSAPSCRARENGLRCGFPATGAIRTFEGKSGITISTVFHEIYEVKPGGGITPFCAEHMARTLSGLAARHRRGEPVKP